MGIRNDRVVVLRGYSPEADCLPHQSSNAFGLHLLHDLSAIAINRSHADVKLGRDGVAGESVRHQIEDFDMRKPTRIAIVPTMHVAVIDAGRPGSRLRNRLLSAACATVARKRAEGYSSGNVH
jgi:hypothetical protein